MEEQVADLEAIYNKSIQDYKQQFPLQIMNDLQINNVHAPAIGVWPSTALIRKDIELTTPMDLPDVESALVVPFYNANSRLSHLKLLSLNKQHKHVTHQVGISKLGWFNFIGAARSFMFQENANPMARLMIYDNLQGALCFTNGVYSDVVSQVNVNQLTKITYKLSLKGNMEFFRKFQDIEGFDITIGKTEKSVFEYLQTDFIFNDLIDQDMRVIIPRATDYAKSLPLYEREAFNDQMKKILKVDLKRYSPLLFERYNDEKSFMQKLRDYFKDNYKVDIKLNDKEGEVLFLFNIKPNNSKHLPSVVESFAPLSPQRVAERVSLYEGDILSFVEKVSPPPLRYWWEPGTEGRIPRTQLYAIIREVLYQIFLGMTNERLGNI